MMHVVMDFVKKIMLMIQAESGSRLINEDIFKI